MLSRLTSRICFLLLAINVFTMPPALADEAADGSSKKMTAGSQFYEIRSYVLGEKGDEVAVDAYLKDALLPALARQNIGPVGAFSPTKADETGANTVFVVIPFDGLEQFASVRDALADDAQYQSAAKAYLDRPHTNPAFARIRSELLSSMACWPTLQIADGSLENDERVYELRVYESANERIGDVKVEMFNAGEVPIFLDCNITPLFIGQCLLGPQMPSLTYLTMYPSEAARQKAWDDFRAHPDWKVLSAQPKYAGTVSRIDKFVLAAKPYSQM